MMYELVLLACLADRPRSEDTCRALYAPLGDEAYCEEQKALAKEALHRDGFRVMAFCVPTAPIVEVRK